MSNKRHAQYREAACKIACGLETTYYDRWFEEHKLKVSPTANVHEMQDGAFVELHLWVPREEADKESGESNNLSLPKKL